MKTLLHLSDEVRAAMASGKPVVALESTVISHGLPHPLNIQTALRMEEAIRGEGAVPATIGLIEGRICVGLSVAEIERLGSGRAVRKCSRRDLAIAAARKEDGATTVAGTMLVAHAAGIRLFATGGIGGVHRGQPHDVSADLMELAQTPVTVVCSGAKSILDLPLTLEVLETQGVAVLGFRTDEFPAFYTRRSGLRIDQRCDHPGDVAAIIEARDALGLSSGLIVGVPVPELDELSPEESERAVEAALHEAARCGITGKEVTPFLLARVSELTGHRSQTANTSLLVNNARVAAQIGCALG